MSRGAEAAEEGGTSGFWLLLPPKEDGDLNQKDRDTVRIPSPKSEGKQTAADIYSTAHPYEGGSCFENSTQEAMGLEESSSEAVIEESSPGAWSP
mmetsp:Transcript_9505/g.25799  ORF Transcript_9505/g.25799 Transcript_9505/m.25799 type:complete len:95 (-) Transcript_9505:315-599(-)